MSSNVVETRDYVLGQRFLEDGRPLVDSTPGLSKVNFFNVQDEIVATLANAITHARPGKVEKYKNRYRQTLDQVYPPYTEIQLKANGESQFIFIDLLEALDELARLRGGLVLQKKPRIFQFKKSYKEYPWMLVDAIWHFSGK